MMTHQGIASNFSRIFSSILLLFSPFSSSINPPTLANSVLTAFPRVSSTSLVYSNDRVEERIKSTQWCSITWSVGFFCSVSDHTQPSQKSQFSNEGKGRMVREGKDELMTILDDGFSRIAWMIGNENLPSVKSSAKFLFSAY